MHTECNMRCVLDATHWVGGNMSSACRGTDMRVQGNATGEGNSNETTQLALASRARLR